MDAKGLIPILANFGVPVLATVLGVPELAGPALVILGKIFGVAPDPVAIGTAVQNDPAAADKLAAAESEAAAHWSAIAAIAQADAQQSSSVNETMRAEIAAGRPWYHWRNLWGYSCTIECSCVAAVILHGLWTGDQKAIGAFQNVSGFFITWYGMRLGVLGVVTTQGTRERAIAMTGQNPIGAVGHIIKAVTGR